MECALSAACSGACAQILPEYIPALYQRFHAKKWERFNSEKVCHISYARIQGKANLVTHFQNSSLLHEDKRCRPILFRSDGATAGEQEPFPAGPNVRLTDCPLPSSEFNTMTLLHGANMPSGSSTCV